MKLDYKSIRDNAYAGTYEWDNLISDSSKWVIIQ